MVDWVVGYVADNVILNDVNKKALKAAEIHAS